jgi:hypothetical protein
MSEFEGRQYQLIEATILQYRQRIIDLRALVNTLDAIRSVLSESSLREWNESLFDLIFDLERINSELVVAKREIILREAEKVNFILTSIQTLVLQQKTAEDAGT